MHTFMKQILRALAAFGFVAAALPVQAQECFIGELRMFAGNFAPRSWALAQGQLMAIAQNTALFSILGTTYGGNGQTTFGLPDLRGRAPIGTGQGPGFSDRQLGELGGSERQTLNTSQMPMHQHTLGVTTAPATSSKPSGGNKVLAAVQGAGAYAAAATDTILSPASAGVAGGNQPFDIMPPYLGINYIICLEGIFPSRN
jgi:microcystin-dependent protein